MKLNVQKLQIGGRPFFSAVVNPFSAGKADMTATASSSSSGGSSIISDKTMDELIHNGIPNDVQQFYNMLAKFEQQADFGLGVNRQQLYALRSYANQVIQQYKYLNKAEEEANKNGAWDEVAVSPRGELFVLDKNGKLGKTTLNNFDASKQEALTVGQLLEYRKYSPDLVNNTEVATTVSNGVGMEKISSYIQDIIKTVGTSEDASEAYVDVATVVGKNNAKRPTTSQFQALRGIAKEWNDLGMDAIFKLSESSKDSNVREGLNYILSVLPRNMQLQLRANWVANGNDISQSGDYITNVVLQALMSSRDQKYQYGFDYAADINKAAKTKAGTTETTSSKSYYKTPLETFFDGNLNQTDIRITDPTNNNKYGLSVKGNTLGALVNDNGKTVTNAPLSVALNASIGKYLDYSQTYIGDQAASENQLKDIAYGNDPMAAVWMPVLNDGSIDWQGFYAYSIAEQKCKENNITDPSKKNQIHASYGSYARFNAEGNQIVTDGVEQFFLTYGYTIDDLVGDSKLNMELTGDKEQAADDLINAIYNKNVAKTTGIKSMSHKQSWDDIVKVPIFIKISPNAASDARIFAGHGPSESPHTEDEFMVRQQIIQQPLKQENVITANSQLLYSQE